MPPSRMTEQVGRVLGGRYRLLAPIGRGASAQVFLAADVRLERQVAVKVLHEALADDQVFPRRFQAEAQAAAALNHPHVMAVYDWGHDGEVPWIVTEFLGGGSLRGLFDRGHLLTPSQALVVGLQAARGLDYAHRRGFVHRDIKPANLLFGDEGRLRIADFGLARALAEAAWTEPQGTVVGTARYASPEQAQGRSLTGRADVYSLALVMVEAVTGEVPFATDTTLGTLMARVGRPLVPPEALGPLVEVLARAGEPEADDRIDARALALALAAVAPSLPRPAALALPGALDVDLSDDRDPTSLASPTTGALAAVGPVSADDMEVPDFVNGAGSPTEAWSGDRTDWFAEDGDDAVEGAAVALGSFAGEGLLLADDPALDDLDDVMAWAPEGPADATTVRPPVDPTVVRRMGWDASPADDDDDDDDLGLDLGLDEEDDAPYDWDPRSPNGRRRRRWPRVVFAVLLVAALGAAAGLLVADLTAAPPSSVVPVVAGLDEDAARSSLEAQGWRVTVTRDRRDGTAAGDALRTDPDVGTDLDEGEPITLVVSEGPTLVDLPALTRGMARVEAEMLLVAVDLVPVVEERFDEEVIAGQVVEVTGAPPSSIERGSEVGLVVSRGPEPRTLPADLVGAGQDDVVARLTELGLVAEVSEEFSDDVEAGLVVSTDPGPGAQAEKGAPVAVVVSRGPDLVTVPDVGTAVSLDEAVDLLEEAGLAAGDVTGPARGVPSATSPGAGEQVRRGSEVDITFTRGGGGGGGGGGGDGDDDDGDG